MSNNCQLSTFGALIDVLDCNSNHTHQMLRSELRLSKLLVPRYPGDPLMCTKWRKRSTISLASSRTSRAISTAASFE